jgi:adenine-specific DNA-methyltransferase
MPWLQWHKRDEDIKRAGEAPYRLLEAVSEHDYGDPESPNMLIQGDNLEALIRRRFGCRWRGAARIPTLSPS